MDREPIGHIQITLMNKEMIPTHFMELDRIEHYIDGTTSGETIYDRKPQKLFDVVMPHIAPILQ